VAVCLLFGLIFPATQVIADQEDPSEHQTDRDWGSLIIRKGTSIFRNI
jgi:hypothetical protein